MLKLSLLSSAWCTNGCQVILLPTRSPSVHVTSSMGPTTRFCTPLPPKNKLLGDGGQIFRNSPPPDGTSGRAMCVKATPK